MPKLIQIRNVPEAVHRRLKVRAAQAGTSLSEMLLREAVRLAETPTRTELFERIRKRSSVTPTEGIADAVAAERRARTR